MLARLIARAMPHGDILGFAAPLAMKAAEMDGMGGIASGAAREVIRSLAD